MRLADARLLSFDCYGTLIDWELGITTTAARLAGAHGVHPRAEEILALFAAHETLVQDAHPTWSYPTILAETWRRMAASMGLPSPATAAERGEADARAFAASVPEWPAFADSHDALVDLASRCRLVILSNVDRASFEGSRARLDVRFDAVITAQDVGSYKPDPANFRALLARAAEMGAGRDAHLHVAQSLYHDHVPAKAAGLATVRIDRYGATRAAAGGAVGAAGATPAAAPVKPDWTYPSLRAFADALLVDD
jgi:2-haloalkanoic acid dehalogenase type II